jgi:hypothetical protein
MWVSQAGRNNIMNLKFYLYCLGRVVRVIVRLSVWLSWEKEEYHSEFWWSILLQTDSLKDRCIDGMKLLKRVLIK